MNTKSPDVENRSDNSSADRASSLDKMKAILVARLKAKPGNAEAWREFAQVKRMMGDIDLFCLMEDFVPGTSAEDWNSVRRCLCASAADVRYQGEEGWT